MEWIVLNESNIEQEHICCAMTDKKAANGVKLKKNWLKRRFEEGLVFKKADVKGKVFIEYLPAENAWSPIEAGGYTFINCLWVAGSFKGKGYGKKLLDDCLTEAAEKNGVVVLSSRRKKPYLADKAFFMAEGFELADTALPYFELLVKRLNPKAPMPRFKDCVKTPPVSGEQGLTILYTDQCPFVDYYINDELDKIQQTYGIAVKRVKLVSKEQAQNAPAAFTTYSAFFNGVFLTHEILTESKFGKIYKSIKIGSGCV